MCGIAAILAHSPDAPEVDRAELIRIRDAMTRRGPDGCGDWLSADGRLGLGHRRLSIIDLSPAGAQPMKNQDGSLVVTFNGEIYNYRQLRSQLEQKGYRFQSTSDTEVLLHLYAEKGEEMVHDLRGMYAFAIWDAAKHRLFLARDPFGIKPLYYADDGKTFRTASQVKALLAGGKIDTSPEPAGHVGYFLWGHVPAPYTLYRGIRCLPAGHSLTVEPGGKKRLRVFCSIPGILEQAEGRTTEDGGRRTEDRGQRPEIRSRKSGFSVSEFQLSAFDKDALGSALRDSIRHHLIADVPVGVFLSSGLDSTTIAALASEFGGELRTVTLGFEEYKGTPNDETALAEEVARHYGTRHQTIWVTRKDFENDLHRLFHAMDQPSCDGVNSYFISKAAAQAGLKVALSGLGGDELFGSYPSFREIPRIVGALSSFHNGGTVGRAFRAVSAPLLKRMTSPKYAGLLEYGGTYGGAYLLRRGMFMPWELPEILDGDLVREGWNELQTLARLDETSNGIHSPHLKISALEMTWYMRHQLLRDADWASMEHSLEVRVPLVDTELLCATAPLFTREPHPGKRDMALTPRLALPASVLNRPKTGFQVPVRQWLLEGRQKTESGNRKSGERGLRGWAKEVYRQFPNAAPNKGSSVGSKRPAASSSPPRRVVVFRIGQLGDTIVALPAMWAIRKHFPDASLTLLCDRHPGTANVLAADLLSGAGIFNAFESYVVDDEPRGKLARPWRMLKLLRRLRRGKFDTLVYLSPNIRRPEQVERDRRFFSAAGIKQFIGMDGFVKLPRKIPGQPIGSMPFEADSLLARLAADGIPIPGPGQGCMDLGIGTPEESEVRQWLGTLPGDGGRLWIAFGPGSKMPAKQWSMERFAEVGNDLISRFDIWPVVFGGPDDSNVAAQLLGLWGRGYSAAGRLSVRGASQALKSCALYVGNDTGTMHLAVAGGIRCVAIFSARHAPGAWNPYGKNHRVFQTQIECEGCLLVECVERKNECLTRIAVAPVVNACKEILQQNLVSP